MKHLCNQRYCSFVHCNCRSLMTLMAFTSFSDSATRWHFCVRTKKNTVCSWGETPAVVKSVAQVPGGPGSWRTPWSLSSWPLGSRRSNQWWWRQQRAQRPGTTTTTETDLLLGPYCATLTEMLTIHQKPPKGSHVIVGWFGFISSLDTVSEEAEDCADPQQHGETAKQLSTRNKQCSSFKTSSTGRNVNEQNENYS